LNSRNQSYIIYLLLFIAIVAMVYFNIRQQPDAQGPLTISQVAQQIQEGNITRIVVHDDNSLDVISSSSSGPVEQSARKEPETTLVSQLVAFGITPEQLANVTIEVNPPSPWAGLLTLATYIIPFLLIGGILVHIPSGPGKQQRSHGVREVESAHV
jgi:cell division protease FtsH